MLATLLVLAPFAILRLDAAAIDTLDLGTLTQVGGRATYQTVTVHRTGPLDRTLKVVETDCTARRARVVGQATAARSYPPKPLRWTAGPAAWRPVAPDELRAACTGEVRGLQVIPSLDVARVILNAGSGRIAD